jgi:hypothetical protein
LKLASYPAETGSARADLNICLSLPIRDLNHVRRRAALNLSRKPPDQCSEGSHLIRMDLFQGSHRRSSMLRKSTMIALAAVAALGLAVGNANAFPQVKPMPIKPFPVKPIPIKPFPIKPIPIKPIKPIVVPIWPKPKPGVIVIHRPYPTPVVVGGPTYIASRPVVSRPGPCTCLTKEYTPQGQVLFKDRCTNEAAINPPLQQQGAVEAPQQTAATYQQQPANMLPQQPVQ